MKNSEFKEIYNQISKGKSGYWERELEDGVYKRKFIPEDRLILFGAGHIAQPVCHIATLLDFNVVVVDDRMAFANEERFPDAHQILCMPFEEAIEELEIRDSDYVCIMTRGHQYDGMIMRRILEGTMPFFLGMVGSVRRIAGLREVMLEEGYKAEDFDKLHAPLGVPINSITVAEIGVSICAQLVEAKRSVPDVEETILEQTNVDNSMVEFLKDNKGAMMVVLETSGSTPVKSGAMMAIDGAGNTFGTIGGGCSEAAVMGHARRIIGTGKSKVVEVDMSNEAAAAAGMACGGWMSVLIEDVED